MERCHRCASASSSVIPFWDGKFYCQTCVEACCPGLYEYARSHATLEEWFLPEQVSMWRAVRYIFTWSIVGAASLTVVHWAFGYLQKDRALDAAGAVILIPTLLTAGILPMLLVLRCWLPKRLTVADGLIKIEARGKSETYPLANCAWCVGSVLADPIGLLVATTRPTIIVFRVAPAPNSGTLMCGVTADASARWRALYALAGTPQLRPRTGIRGLLRILSGSVVGGFVGGVLGILVGAGIGYFIGEPKWLRTAANSGIVTGLLVGFIYAGWEGEERQLARNERRTLFIGIVLCFIIPAVISWAFALELGVLATLAVASVHAGKGRVFAWGVLRRLDSKVRTSGVDSRESRP